MGPLFQFEVRNVWWVTMSGTGRTAEVDKCSSWPVASRALFGVRHEACLPNLQEEKCIKDVVVGFCTSSR